MKQFAIPFQEVFIPLRQPGSKEKILQYSPLGKVPVLIDGTTSVWESLAIAEYLAELFPGKNLWPKDKNVRARARAVSGEMYSGFIALRKQFPQNITGQLAGKASHPDADRDIQRVLAIWEGCRKDFAKQGDFLFGSFSIADAMYVPVVYRFKTYGIPLTGAAEDYAKTIQALPAMKQWVEDAAKENFPWI